MENKKEIPEVSYRIEKSVSRFADSLIRITRSGGKVKREVLVTDIPKIVKAKLDEVIQDG